MKDKVYEMDDGYKEAADGLLELIVARDVLKETLKTVHPSRLAEGYVMLRDINEKIEKLEAALAREYEAHQKACRAREAHDKLFGEISDSVDSAYIYLKHLHPETFKTVQAQFYKDWTPDQIKEFEDHIAHLEATRLEDFIGTD